MSPLVVPQLRNAVLLYGLCGRVLLAVVPAPSREQSARCPGGATTPLMTTQVCLELCWGHNPFCFLSVAFSFLALKFPVHCWSFRCQCGPLLKGGRQRLRPNPTSSYGDQRWGKMNSPFAACHSAPNPALASKAPPVKRYADSQKVKLPGTGPETGCCFHNMFSPLQWTIQPRCIVGSSCPSDCGIFRVILEGNLHSIIHKGGAPPKRKRHQF